jgi:hypothetical protein
MVSEQSSGERQLRRFFVKTRIAVPVVGATAAVGSDWMRAVRKLEANYALSGPAALELMTGVEAYVLYEEKVMSLKAAQKMLAEDPAHKRWKLRCDQLSLEVGHIESWLKTRVRPFNEKQRDQAEGPGTGFGAVAA